MRETIEFRLPEESARRVLAPSDGTTLGGSVRKIVLEPSDARFARIRDADAAMRADGRALFTSWKVHRLYRPSELDDAAALRLMLQKVFEPAGEECGTEYDEASACPVCGAGARQVGELRLDVRRIPKNTDLARSIADEWVVSQRFAEILVDEGFSGFELALVSHAAAPDTESIDLQASRKGLRLLERAEAAGHRPGSGDYWVWLNRREQRAVLDDIRSESSTASARRKTAARLPVWHQLKIVAKPVPLCGPTKFGIDVFDDDEEGRYRCPLGHVAGLNLLSEVHADTVELPADFAITRKLVGERIGLLRPAPLLLVSQRVRTALVEADIKGYGLEAVHLRRG